MLCVHAWCCEMANRTTRQLPCWGKRRGVAMPTQDATLCVSGAVSECSPSDLIGPRRAASLAWVLESPLSHKYPLQSLQQSEIWNMVNLSGLAGGNGGIRADIGRLGSENRLAFIYIFHRRDTGARLETIITFRGAFRSGPLCQRGDLDDSARCVYMLTRPG